MLSLFMLHTMYKSNFFSMKLWSIFNKITKQSLLWNLRKPCDIKISLISNIRFKSKLRIFRKKNIYWYHFSKKYWNKKDFHNKFFQFVQSFLMNHMYENCHCHHFKYTYTHQQSSSIQLYINFINFMCLQLTVNMENILSFLLNLFLNLKTM